MWRARFSSAARDCRGHVAPARGAGGRGGPKPRAWAVIPAAAALLLFLGGPLSALGEEGAPWEAVFQIIKEIHSTGDIGIVSAAASAPNQNAWIGYMKQQLKKYPKMHLVSVVYGNDDPTTATQVTQGLLQQHPNLKGIISPTTVGILAAAQVVDSPKYKGKVAVTGLGTPNSLKKYVADQAKKYGAEPKGDGK